MHGNVAEWCEDIRHDNYKRAPADGSAWIIVWFIDSWIDKINKIDFARISRGGSFFDMPDWFCRSASRHGCLPLMGDVGGTVNQGFRVVLEIPVTW